MIRDIVANRNNNPTEKIVRVEAYIQQTTWDKSYSNKGPSIPQK